MTRVEHCTPRQKAYLFVNAGSIVGKKALETFTTVYWIISLFLSLERLRKHKSKNE